MTTLWYVEHPRRLDALRVVAAVAVALPLWMTNDPEFASVYKRALACVAVGACAGWAATFAAVWHREGWHAARSRKMWEI